MLQGHGGPRVHARGWGAAIAAVLLFGCTSYSPNAYSPQNEDPPTDAPSTSLSSQDVEAALSPKTVPALREWTAASSANYTFSASTRIVVDSGHLAGLTETAAVLAADLLELSGRTVATVSGSSADVRAGDIFLELGSNDAQLGDEGYALQVDAALRIQARTAAGVFYGTRTALQWLHQSYSIGAGRARDWPRYGERGLMVDVGRKYFSVGWLRAHVRELAYLKMNYFHLHLSETQGFRLESTTHPEVVSADHYTKQQIRDLIELARQYHVTVVPEIDMPGHMTAILNAHPNLRLTSSSGSVNNDYIDLSLDGSYALMKDLITEYLPLFPAPYWHLGADEYVSNFDPYPQLLAYARSHYGSRATGRDTYYGFVNWANGIVRSAGKTLRMWNDGIRAGSDTLTVDSNIVVEYWTNQGLTPQELLDKGHTIHNGSYKPTYYVLGVGHPDITYDYETWTPNRFQGDNLVAEGESRNRGAKVHVWCDHADAETEAQVRGGIGPVLHVLAQQVWGSNKPAARYSDFQPIISAIGHAPGTPVEVRKGDLALGRPVTASSVETPDFPAENAVDGLVGARWSSAQSDPQWLQVDLGSRQAIGKVFLTWETAYAKAYQVQVSDDGASWTTLYSTTAGAGGVERLTGLNGNGRYLRVSLTQRGTKYGYSLYEVEVYPPSTADVPAGDLVQGRTVSVSSTETPNFPAPYAADGRYGTRWSSAQTDGQWLQVDLGSVRPIGKLFLDWETAYASSYQVQVSNDGATWTTLYGTTAGKGGFESLVGLGASGRYLRLNLRQRGTQYGFSLYEVEAYSD